MNIKQNSLIFFEIWIKISNLEYPKTIQKFKFLQWDDWIFLEL